MVRWSIARLLRRMHDVSTTVPFELDATWSSEIADPLGGEVFCHNDVCLENVVFRDEVAVGLLDFDFAASGRREFDLASFARMCVPIDESIARGGEFVRRRAEAGQVAFIEMWEAIGGQERFDRRHRWWVAARIDFEEGLQ